MKLAEAFAKKAYRNRNEIQGQHCSGTAGVIAYDITLSHSSVQQLEATDRWEEVNDHLDSWLRSLGVGDYNHGFLGVWQEVEEPIIEITVPVKVSLQEVINKIDSFIAQEL